MASLELRSVSLTYPGADHPALDGVTCGIGSGQFIALVGHNGCGKSTLARIATGLLKPDSGTVEIDGEPLKPGWNGVGLLFQNPDEQLLAGDVERELAWGLENLALPLGEIEARVRGGLEAFGLTCIAHQPPETLSDGQKQLVALAALAVMQPRFLILDEATAFLDPYWTKLIRQRSRELVPGAGVLWLTARASEAAPADIVWVMNRGRMVVAGGPEGPLEASTQRQLNTNFRLKRGEL